MLMFYLFYFFERRVYNKLYPVGVYYKNKRGYYFMNILKYLLSKSYRHRLDSAYTKDICGKLTGECKQKQDIYESIFNSQAKR